MGQKRSLSAKSVQVGLAGALLASSLLLPSTPAAAQTTYNVEVGRYLKAKDPSRESLRFLPGDIKIHQGDRVRFHTASFHSVTLLPVDTDVDEWVEMRAGGVGKQWSLFTRDPDEGPDALKTNLNAVWPSRSCGWPGQAPCSFSGYDSETLHSGLALFPQGRSADTKQLDFTVTINSDPGEVVTVVDVLHPKMRMEIEVVPATDEASDPQDLASAANAQVKRDVKDAAKLAKKYSKKKVVKKVKGKSFRTVWAGVEQDGVALRGFFPKTVKIKAGQGVRWAFDANLYSSHTVTFPVKTGVALAGTFPEFVCDPDGDEGTAPDAKGTASAPYCANVFQLELDVPAGFGTQVGDGKYAAGKDIENSGVRGAGLALSDDPYSLLFTKPSNKKGFAYMDLIYEIAHSPMRGAVIVQKGKK